MSDHIHLLLSIPSKYSISQVMGYLKGKSARMIFERHANLKYKFGNRHFWAEGYYVSTVGLNIATIQKVPLGWKVSMGSGIQKVVRGTNSDELLVVCICPIVITKRLENFDDGTEKIELSFFRDVH